MKCMRFGRFLVAMALIATLFAAAVVAEEARTNWAALPDPRTDEGWIARNNSFNARVKQGNADMIWIGDSITHGWENEGKAVWDKYYAKRNAVNLGIAGDQTQHVIWRLDNGNLEGISPKLAIIMIGTNNAGGHTPADIAGGIKAIVDRLRTKLPQMKVLVLGIFPRGETSEDEQRKVIVKTNEIIANLADNKMVFYLDITPTFLAADGTLSKDIMPDFLHPNPKGYEMWAEAVEPTIAKLMGEK